MDPVHSSKFIELIRDIKNMVPLDAERLESLVHLTSEEKLEIICIMNENIRNLLFCLL